MKGAELFECLFDSEGTVDNNGVANYRTKTETAGVFKYVSIYPMWETYTRQQAREDKKKQSKDVIDRHKRKTVQRETEKLMNANFGEGDIILTLTYEEQPETDEEAIRDINAYIRRVKRLRKRKGLDDLKFIRTTEMGKRYHHHLIVNGGIGREELERLWDKGLANSRRVQWMKEGLAGFAQYITKYKETQRKCGHSYACSRNLVKPKATVADHKISVKQVERMAEDIKEQAKGILEKKYKGYSLIGDIVVQTSEYAPGAWIYARLRRTDTDGERGTTVPSPMGAGAGGGNAGAAKPYPHTE